MSEESVMSACNKRKLVSESEESGVKRVCANPSPSVELGKNILCAATTSWSIDDLSNTTLQCLRSTPLVNFSFDKCRSYEPALGYHLEERRSAVHELQEVTMAARVVQLYCGAKKGRCMGIMVGEKSAGTVGGIGTKYAVAYFSGLGVDESVGGEASLPLVLVRGNNAVLAVVLEWVQKYFSCRVSKLNMPPPMMAKLLARWARVGVDTQECPVNEPMGRVPVARLNMASLKAECERQGIELSTSKPSKGDLVKALQRKKITHAAAVTTPKGSRDAKSSKTEMCVAVEVHPVPNRKDIVEYARTRIAFSEMDVKGLWEKACEREGKGRGDSRGLEELATIAETLCSMANSDKDSDSKDSTDQPSPRSEHTISGRQDRAMSLEETPSSPMASPSKSSVSNTPSCPSLLKEVYGHLKQSLNVSSTSMHITDLLCSNAMVNASGQVKIFGPASVFNVLVDLAAIITQA